MFVKPEFKSLGDVIAKYVIYDLDNENVQGLLQKEVLNFLSSKLEDPDDMILLKIYFKFDKSRDKVDAIGENLISSLWLIGIFPPLPIRLQDRYVYTHNDKVYAFNPKNNKLAITDHDASPKHKRNN